MSIDKEVPVTAVDTHYDEKTGQLLLLQGDESGYIVVYDISVIIGRVTDMHPVDITKNNAKRNPHREFPIEDRARRAQEERKGRIGKTRMEAAAMDSDSEIEES